MRIFALLMLSALISLTVMAGSVTIEKSDSLIRNDLFDKKRERAEDYKLREAQRNRKNDRWSSTIDPSCGLLKNRYLIYFCASNGRYYKAYESDHKREYRELSTSEVKNLGKGKD